MPTIFSGINLALRALLAHQQSQLVTNHNIANANTPGYTRQEAVLVPERPYTLPAFNRPEMALQLGQGVLVSSLRRFTLDFFDDRLRKETADASDWGERASTLQQVESLLPEADGAGLSARLDSFWSAWQSLSADPADTGLRATVINAADRLTAMVRDRASALNATRRDENALVTSLVGEVNNKAANIARLNKQIISAVGAGDNPNDLLDQRDILLDDLAKLSGSTVNFQSNGDALVSIGGHILVAAGVSQTLTAADTNGDGLADLSWSADNLAASITSGRIGGALKARDTDIPARLTALDSLASALVARVNAVHTTAFGLPPANVTGQNFFTGTNALTLAVNSTLAADPTQLGAAASAASPGDGSKALAAAQIANALVMSGGTRTLNNFWADTIAQLGLDTKRAGDEESARGLVRDALGKQKQSVAGVSLDEEAARLVQSQRAYEAAARVLTAFDEMADTIINRMGVVGR